jgi:Berberine and berberine like
LDTDAAKKVWQSFFDWIAQSPNDYSIPSRVIIASAPARHWWDRESWKALVPQPVFKFDDRPGARPDNAWWAGNSNEVGMYLWGYDSLWLPASLLEDSAQPRLADALFASSRVSSVGLHFNKGLAGGPPEAIAAAKETSTNPAVLTAFALVIVAEGQDHAYPGIPGHQPQMVAARSARERIDRCMNHLRALVRNPGSYVNETSYFEKNWQDAFWGGNYPRLAEIKQKYDPDGLFFVHNGVGSEQWSTDGFARV